MAQRPAELPARGRQHLAAEQVASQVQTVADAEHRDAEVEDLGIAQGSAGGVDAGGASGEDQAAWLQLRDARGGEVMADQLAEDVLFADPARDELGVLRAEVED